MIHCEATPAGEDGLEYEIKASILWRRVERVSLTVRHVYPKILG
jgi:hypothetical protein